MLFRKKCGREGFKLQTHFSQVSGCNFFHNGLKHYCSLKSVSILRVTLWKVVMKCKIVMFFNLLGSFSQNANF